MAQLAFVFQTIKGLPETQRLAARALSSRSSLPFDPYAFRVIDADLTDAHFLRNALLQTPHSVLALTAYDLDRTASLPSAASQPLLSAAFPRSHLKIDLRKGPQPLGDGGGDLTPRSDGISHTILVLLLSALGVLGLLSALDASLLPVVSAMVLTKDMERHFEDRLARRGVMGMTSKKPGIKLLRAIYGLEGDRILRDQLLSARTHNLEFLADLVAPMLKGIYPEGLEDPVLILFLWSLGVAPPDKHEALLRLMHYSYDRIEPYPPYQPLDGLRIGQLYLFKPGKDLTHVPTVYVFDGEVTDPTRGELYDFTHLGSSPNPRWMLSPNDLIRKISQGQLFSLKAIPVQRQHDEKEEGPPPQVLELGGRKEIADTLEAAYKEINTWWDERDIAQLKNQLVNLRTSPSLHSNIIEDYVMLVLNRIASDRNVPDTKRQEAAITALEYWLKVMISPDVKRTIKTILTKLQGEAASAYVTRLLQPLGEQLIKSLDPLGIKRSKRPTKKTGGPFVSSPFEEALTVGDEAKRKEAERFLRLLDWKMVGDDQVTQLTSSVIMGIEHLRNIAAQQRPALEQRVGSALRALISLFYRSDMGEQQLEGLKTELKRRHLTDVPTQLTVMLENAGERLRGLKQISKATPEWWLAYHRMMWNQMPPAVVSAPKEALRQATTQRGKTNAWLSFDLPLGEWLLPNPFKAVFFSFDPWMMVQVVFFLANVLLVIPLMVQGEDPPGPKRVTKKQLAATLDGLEKDLTGLISPTIGQVVPPNLAAPKFLQQPGATRHDLKNLLNRLNDQEKRYPFLVQLFGRAIQPRQPPGKKDSTANGFIFLSLSLQGWGLGIFLTGFTIGLGAVAIRKMIRWYQAREVRRQEMAPYIFPLAKAIDDYFKTHHDEEPELIIHLTPAAELVDAYLNDPGATPVDEAGHPLEEPLVETIGYYSFRFTKRIPWDQMPPGMVIQLKLLATRLIAFGIDIWWRRPPAETQWTFSPEARTKILTRVFRDLAFKRGKWRTFLKPSRGHSIFLLMGIPLSFYVLLHMGYAGWVEGGQALVDPQGLLGPLAGYYDQQFPIAPSKHLDLAALLGWGTTPTAGVIPPVRGVLEVHQQYLSRLRVLKSQL
ncbi:MAG: hypothetical protein HYZ73_01850 [Elusimicrobia bacterium]|nr:hypothetical protein [Elusimicrobiota bacterium]